MSSPAELGALVTLVSSAINASGLSLVVVAITSATIAAAAGFTLSSFSTASAVARAF